MQSLRPMIQKSLHTKASSPIKKQLAKRIITYFDQLENAKTQERSSERGNGSRSRSRSKSKSYIEYSEPDKVVYDDVENRKKKLEDLKNLMKKELLQAKSEGSTDSFPEDIYKSVHGYPSFMKSQRTNEQYRRKPTAEADLNAFKKSVHKLLEERVLKADGKDPRLEESYDYDTLLEETQKSMIIDPSKSVLKSTYNSKNNLFDENLYPIERDKTVISQSPVDGKKFDFHQRKSKEIRRLQYGNGLRDRSVSKDKPIKQYSEVPITKTIDESNVINDDKQTGRPRERRTHPDETQDVFVRFTDGNRVWTVPALIRNILGFKTNDDHSVEVREHDRVVLSNRPDATSDEIFASIHGAVDRFYPDRYNLEKDCDLVVQTPDGRRHPVLFSLRQTELEPIIENEPVIDSEPQIENEPEPKRVHPPEPAVQPNKIKPIRNLADANCTAFDPSGRLLGRGKLALNPYDEVSGEPISYGKGILLSEDNEKVEFVLVRFTPGDQCTLKRQNLSNTSHRVESIEAVEIPGYKLKYVTLIENTPRANPELLVLLDGPYNPQKDRLLTGEPASCELEDWRYFKGNLKYQHNHSDREGVLWLDLFPEEIEAAKQLIGKDVVPSWENSFKCPPLGNDGESLDRIRLEMDDVDPDTDISNLLDLIKSILQRSKVQKSDVVEDVRVLEPPVVEHLSQVVSKPVQDSVRVSQLKESVVEVPPPPITDGVIDVIVNGPNNMKLRIFICPKGQIAQVEDVIAETYGPPKANPSPMSLQVGQETFTPDGLRSERTQGPRASSQSGLQRTLPHWNEQQAARTLEQYDLRVVQFNVQAPLEDQETRRIRDELEILRRSKDSNRRSVEVQKSRDSLIGLSQIRAQEAADARRFEEEAAQRARDAQDAARRAQELADQLKRDQDAKKVQTAMLEVRRRADEAAQAAKREEDARRVRQSMLEAQRRADEALQAQKAEEEARKLRQSAEQSLQEIAKKSRKGSTIEVRASQDLVDARRKEEQAIRVSKDASILARSTAEAAELLKRQEEEKRIQDALDEQKRRDKEAQQALEEKAAQVRRSQILQDTLRQSMEAAEKIQEEIRAQNERMAAERALQEALDKEAAAKAEEDRLNRLEQEENERQEAAKKLRIALLDAQKRADEAAEAKKKEDEATKKAQEALDAARRAEEAAEAAKRLEKARLADEAAAQARIDEQNRKAIEAAHAAKKDEEIRKIREADDLARRQAAHTQAQEENDARRRQQEEIEQTQKKVQELKQALEKSKISQADSGPKIFKGPSEAKGPSRYENEADSVEEKSQISKPSKKPEPKPEPIHRSELADSQARIVPGSTISKRTSGTVVAPQQNSNSKNKNLSQSMAPGKRSNNPVDRKSETLHYTTYVRREVHQSSSKEPVPTTTAQNKTKAVQESTNHYTKIELNLENSYDDIDFIGYGTMKVSTKKDGESKSREGSPDLKYKFTKISPAKNLEETMLPRDGTQPRHQPTNAFTPHSNHKQKGVFSSSKKSVHDSQASRTPSNRRSTDQYEAVT